MSSSQETSIALSLSSRCPSSFSSSVKRRLVIFSYPHGFPWAASVFPSLFIATPSAHLFILPQASAEATLLWRVKCLWLVERVHVCVVDVCCVVYVCLWVGVCVCCVVLVCMCVSVCVVWFLCMCVWRLSLCVCVAYVCAVWDMVSMCTCACVVSALACVCTRVCMHSDSEISFQAVFPLILCDLLVGGWVKAMPAVLKLAQPGGRAFRLEVGTV